MRREFRHSSMEPLPVLGLFFDSGAGTWVVFNQDNLTVLSKHRTEAQAHAACRRYEGSAFRRLVSRSTVGGAAA